MDGGLSHLKEFTEEDLKIKVPSGIVVAGPTMSGKTTLVTRVVRKAKKLFSRPPRSIIYSYGEPSNKLIPWFRKYGAICIPGFPSDELLNKVTKPCLVIIDDLMKDVGEKYLSDLFTKKMHHRDLIVVFLTQNIFEKHLIIARKNSQYMFLMKQKATSRDIKTIGQQLEDKGMSNYFYDAFKKATAKKHGYFFVDNHPQSEDELKYRTDVFPGEITTVFLPKSGTY